MHGYIANIQRFCIHDGPGIRTTVFLKGCPLRCRWCANPETQALLPELMYRRGFCMACGNCLDSCRRDVLGLESGALSYAAERCDLCGCCADVCPKGALCMNGTYVSAGSVIEEVMRDADVFDATCGGVTFSGGEPFFQPQFLKALLDLSKKAGLDTVVETSAHADWENIENCAPGIDHFICDLKHADQKKLEEWACGNAGLVKANISKIMALGKDVLIRIPVIPEFNDDAHSAQAFAAYLNQKCVRKVELLPYHPLGEAKYAFLFRQAAMPEIDRESTEAAVSDLIAALGKAGIETVVSGR